MAEIDRSAAESLLAYAETPPEILASLAQQHPELHDRILAHPKAYPGLRDWILGQRVVRAEHSARPQQASGAQPQPASSSQRRKGLRLWLILGGGAAVLSAVAVSLFVWPGFLKDARTTIVSQLSSISPLDDSVYPSESDRFTISFGDIDAVTEVLGEEPDPEDSEEFRDWRLLASGMSIDEDTLSTTQLFLPDSFGGGSAYFMTYDGVGTAEEIGYNPWLADSYIEVAGAPPRRVVALVGDFPEADITAVLGDAEGGIWSWGGEEYETDPEKAFISNQLGQSLRLGFRDDVLYVSSESSFIPDAPDPESRDTAESAADAETFADVADVVRIAEILDGENAYSGRIIGGTLDDSTIHALDDEGVAPYNALGIGVSRDGDEPRVTVVLDYRTSAAAEENSNGIAELLAQGGEMEGAYSVEDVTVTDSLVVARILPQISGDNPHLAHTTASILALFSP